MLTPSQAGIRFHNHVQTVASTSWTIIHNFGLKPLIEIQIYEGSVLNKAHPLSLTYPDDNTVVIGWSSARTGFATLASDQPI